MLKSADGPIFNFVPFDWQGVSAIAAVFAVLLNGILLASVIYAYRSLRESQLTRAADVMIWAVSQMEEIKDDLKLLRQASRQIDIWPDDVSLAAQRVSVRLQRLAYMARSGLISKDHFRAMWGLTFVEAWEKLEPWVHKRRTDNGEPRAAKDGAFSRVDFEELALEFREFVDQLRARANQKPAASF
jgi:hypothetical protein